MAIDMQGKIEGTKRFARSMLQPKAILVGLAVANFVIFFIEAKRIEGMLFCFGGPPWYSFERFGYFQFVLLVAAFGFFLGRWWSYLIAFAFCVPVLTQMVTNLVVESSRYYSWLEMVYEPSLGLQYALAITLSLASARAASKTGGRTGLPD